MSVNRAAYPADLWVCLTCGFTEPAGEGEASICHPAAVLVGKDDVELDQDGRAVRVKLNQSWRELTCVEAERGPRA